MQNIINLLPSIIMLGMAIVAALWAHKKEKARIDAIGEDIGEDIGEEAVAWERIKEWLRIATFGFVTDAEREHGILQGLQKQSVVLAKVIDLLPPELRGRIHADVILELIEDILNEARERWAENPKLLEPATPDAELVECEPLRLIAAKDIAAGEVVEFCSAFAPVEDESSTGELGVGGTHAEGGTPCGPDAVGEPGAPGEPNEVPVPKRPRKKRVEGTVETASGDAAEAEPAAE